MKKFYITFGSDHKEADGSTLQNCYTVIEAVNEEEARAEALRRFGQHWASIYKSAQEAKVIACQLSYVQYPHIL